jgi:colanic acid biosynthesis glycosyl transferase WcaI
VKFLLHGLNYQPELIGVGKYTGEMAEWLAAQGHEVRVVSAYPYYPQWRVTAPYRNRGWRTEQSGGVRVLRCPLWVPRQPRALARALHLASFAASSAPVVLWQAMRWRPDIVVGFEPTLFAAPATLAAARLSGAAAWLHVQDFEIEAAFATGLVASPTLARWTVGFENFWLRRFDRVSAISRAMCAHAAEKGVAPARIALVPNWAATDDIHPLPHPSPMRAALGIAQDAIVALYAGNMSEKQGLETLVDTARALAGTPGIRFVFAGEGAARARLETASAGLENVMFLPLQPVERLNDLLNLADIHLLPQRRGVADLVMPSKLLGMMASGRPVVAGAHDGSTLAEVAESCGIAVAPEDGIAMADAVRRLAATPAQRAELGAVGRRRVVAEWGRDAVLGQFVRAAAELRAPHHGRRPAADLARVTGSRD